MKRILLAFTSLVVGLVMAQAQYIAPYSGAVSRTNNSKMGDVVSVKDFGAVGGYSADNTAAYTTALAYLSSIGGGTLYFPPGGYCGQIDTTGVASPGSINIVGASVFSVNLSSCGVDQPVVILNSGWSSLSEVTILGKGSYSAGETFGATEPAIWVKSGCGSCKLDHFYLVGGIGILQEGNGTIFSNFSASNSYGSYIFVSRVDGNWLHNFSVDQAWPVSPIAQTSIGAWASATAYTQGTVVSTDGYLIQAKTVTGDNKSGSVAPTLKNYGLDIVDNNVTWRLVSSTTYYGLVCDTGCANLDAINFDATGSYKSAIAMTNSQAGTVPVAMKVMNFGTTYSYNEAIRLDSGSNFQMVNGYLHGCVISTCSSLLTTGSWVGELNIVNSYIDNSTLSDGIGVGLTSGVNTYISNSTIKGGTGAGGKGFYSGANIGKFTLVGNTLTGNSSATVEVGTANNYVITGNNLNGGSVTDGGTGTSKTVALNDGSALSVGNGGTGIQVGTSGGIPYFSSTTSIASSGLLTNFGTVVGSGAGAAPRVVGPGSGGQFFVQQAASDPAFVTMSGDATLAQTGAVALSNIPTGVTMAGSVLATNITAPATPAAGKDSIYVDSTDKRLHDKNDAGTIGTTVVADTGAANNFLTAISAAGVISKAQPSAANLSNGVQGSGAVVLETSPSLVTPSLGVAAATSINFGGTALANYVEGTCTPTLISDATPGTPTYTSQSCTYTRVGRVVTVVLFLATSAWSGPTGNALLGGLPLTIGSVDASATIAYQNGVTYVGAGTQFGLDCLAGTTTCNFVSFGSGSLTSQIPVGNVAAALSLRATITYHM